MRKNIVIAVFIMIVLCFFLAGCKQDPKVEMTASFATARSQFKAVTGLEVPAYADLEVDAFPYQEGDDSYCFDIIGGNAVSYQMYLNFENFFKEKLGNPDSATGDEANGRDVQWTKGGRWYQTYWDKTNNAIYLNTNLVPMS